MTRRERRVRVKDHSQGAEAYRDINPAGPMAHDLPHRYLPLTGYDRRYGGTAEDGSVIFQEDDGKCCQFTAGRLRCQGTKAEHLRRWPEMLFDEVDGEWADNQIAPFGGA
jgi:hypothetical protein